MNKSALTRTCLLIPCFLIFIGCEKIVTIEAPVDGTHDPVLRYQVRFHKDFKPGTFRAFQNSIDITNKFSPDPAPNGVSTASSDYILMAYGNQEVLRVEGDYDYSGIPTKRFNDEVKFSPPVIEVYRGKTGDDRNLDLHEGETITATATLWEPPRDSLSVTIAVDQEDSPISINDQPRGTRVTLTIPGNDRRAAFTIRGIVPNRPFVVRALAHGYACDGGSGTVKK